MKVKIIILVCAWAVSCWSTPFKINTGAEVVFLLPNGNGYYEVDMQGPKYQERNISYDNKYALEVGAIVDAGRICFVSIKMKHESVDAQSLRESVGIWGENVLWSSGVKAIEGKRLTGYYITVQGKADRIQSRYLTEAAMCLDQKINISVSLISKNKDESKLLDFLCRSLESATVKEINHKGQSSTKPTAAPAASSEPALTARIQQFINTQDEFLKQVTTKDAEAWAEAAKRNIPEAQFLHGVYLLYGPDKVKNQIEGVRWIHKAAENNLVIAQQVLSDFYANGTIVFKNGKRAFKWASEAARRDCYPAQRMLGHYYAQGFGVKQDRAAAAQWYKKTADHGDAEAQACLAAIYCDIDKNNEQAFYYWARAAIQGNADGQFSLGKCYEQGIGVHQDLEEAFKWYQNSAAQGNADAAEKVKELQPKIQTMQDEKKAKDGRLF